jgi:hypothetical protein
MPAPDRHLQTLRRAILATRDTAGRTGHFLQLAGASDVLVSGDLHGNIGNFQVLLAQADLANHPKRHFVMQEVIHGPHRYPAGGDKSHQLIDLFAALKCQFPHRVHLMIGNHELAQWTRRVISKSDLDLNALFTEGLRTAYGDRADEVERTYGDLFASAPLGVRTANRVFISHSLPNANRMQTFHVDLLKREKYADADLLPGGYAYSLLWGRDPSPANAAAFLERVEADLLVSGHITCEGGYAVPNDRQVILDSLGAPATYCLFPADRPLTHAELVGCIRFI